MELVFFLTLMLIVLTSKYGVILPSIFAVGTSLPLLVFMFIIWFLGFDGLLMKNGRQINRIVQLAAGGFLIIIGLLDTITYWF